MRSDSSCTILLTGGTGFVGKVICEELAQAFPTYRRALITRNPSAVVDGWELLLSEISDFAAMREVVNKIKPDIVVHLAAQASVASSQGLAEQTWRANFIGTMALGAAISEISPRALFLFVSSGEVYGSNLRGDCVGEATDPKPQNPYSASKLSAEHMLKDVLSPLNKLIVVRPFNHTGPGQDRRFVLPSFAAQIAKTENRLQDPFIYVGNLDVKRDFLHVGDVSKAYLELIKAAPHLPQNTVVNVCSGKALPIRYYLTEMLKMSCLRINIVSDKEKSRSVDVPCSCGDNTLLRSLIDWEPTISPEQICFDLLKHWRSRYA